MNDIIIVTLHDAQPNFGNLLQNYASQSILENSYKSSVRTVIYEKPMPSLFQSFKKYVHAMLLYKYTTRKEYWIFEYTKACNCEKFERKYMKQLYCKGIDDIPPADKYIIGSDQVWNAKWYGEDSIKKDLFLLIFARPDQKVCLAPSFGTNSIPEKWKLWFKTQLSTFPSLAVREEAGAKIIKKLTGRDAEVHIDPTLMLDPEDWRKIERPVKGINTEAPYILTYFLGGLTGVAEKDIAQINEKDEYAVYHIMDKSNLALYAMDPGQFVYMIEHASIILTDSFHACVFSFLFNKPFFVYSREGVETDMLSRMDTLFEKFDLSRKFREVNTVLPVEQIFEHDYSIGYEKLETERDKLRGYLERNLASQGKEQE